LALSKEERDKAKLEQEISILVVKARDDSGLAFEKLREYLDQYIKLFSRKYRIAGCDADEIEQEALYALRYKAIEDFNPERGKFRSFAILCIKRHLFSLIKANNQQKRTVLNQSLSLDEDRSEDGESLSLASLIAEDGLTADQEFERNENNNLKKSRLLSKLSPLEQEVLKLYLRQYHYDEIVDELNKIFPGKKITKKAVDNGLQRVRFKAQELARSLEWI